MALEMIGYIIAGSTDLLPTTGERRYSKNRGNCFTWFHVRLIRGTACQGVRGVSKMIVYIYLPAETWPHDCEPHYIKPTAKLDVDDSTLF